MSMRRQIARIRKHSAVSERRPEAVADPFRSGPTKAELREQAAEARGELLGPDHAMCAEAAEGAVMSTSYALGLLCECCGARCSDGSRRLCAQCRYLAPEATSGVEAATSPWWQDADGVLARVRGDAAVVREIFL
jgi:hypothetical protein